jgi:hypothetical protein
MKFTPYHAYYMPLEKMFEGMESVPKGFEYIEYSPQMVLQAIGDHRSQKCFMRDSQVCIDVDGNYSVCCVESPSSERLGNFLETSHKEMQRQRFTSDLCKKCTASGINIFATYAYEEPEEIQSIIKNLLPYDLEALTHPASNKTE